MIVVCPPKCGTHTLASVVSEVRAPRDHFAPFAHEALSDILRIVEGLEGARPAGAEVVMVVRDPVERLASFMRFMHISNVSVALSRLSSQSDYLDVPEMRTKLFAFERIEEAARYVAGRPILPRVKNRSEGRPRVEDLRARRDEIEGAFRADLELHRSGRG